MLPGRIPVDQCILERFFISRDESELTLRMNISTYKASPFYSAFGSSFTRYNVTSTCFISAAHHGLTRFSFFAFSFLFRLWEHHLLKSQIFPKLVITSEVIISSLKGHKGAPHPARWNIEIRLLLTYSTVDATYLDISLFGTVYPV